MPHTTDNKDPRLNQKMPNGQRRAYLVLPKEEIEKGFVRKLMGSYVHSDCDYITTVTKEIAETFARDPKFYKETFCARCKKHFKVSEFYWMGTFLTVGT